MSDKYIDSHEIHNTIWSSHTIKIVLLGLYFFFVFGAYTILKDLKDSIFMITVGARYIPQVKTISLFLMIPLVMIYGYLSIRIKRKNLLIFYASLYGFGALVMSYFLGHPTIGLANTIADPWRIFGWVSYLFLEGASPFLVSLSWSFLSSISFPDDVKKTYLLMTVMSKIGGAVFAFAGWLFSSNIYTFGLSCNDVAMYSFLMKLAGGSILLLPIILFVMYSVLPKKLLVGYNKEGELRRNEGDSDAFGLMTLLKNSYVIAIFGMVFFWEIINFIFNNLRLNVAFQSSESIGQISSYLFQSTMLMHIIGMVFVLFGTTFFVRKFGERVALLLIPLLTGITIFVFIFIKNPFLINIFYPFLGAINYSLSRPIRESLFIVTSKKIQFSTKQWIDSFGQKFSKSCGSLYTMLLHYVPKTFAYNFQISFFVVLFSLWLLLSWRLGKQWEEAVKNNKIIS
jgi:AAA family ATP:ADP antiporter